MTHTVEAVFENGTFRPIDPIELDNGQHVKLVIEVAENDPLTLAGEVYAGLTSEEIDGVEKISLDRESFFKN
jgi:predicted DNA-binding antitoxin AbrB/MazE fold protein